MHPDDASSSRTLSGRHVTACAASSRRCAARCPRRRRLGRWARSACSARCMPRRCSFPHSCSFPFHSCSSFAQCCSFAQLLLHSRCSPFPQVLLSTEELAELGSDGRPLLKVLQELYKDEWEHFVERCEVQPRWPPPPPPASESASADSTFGQMMARARSNSSPNAAAFEQMLSVLNELLAGPHAEQIRWWASVRAQTLARTVRGVMQYEKVSVAAIERPIDRGQGIEQHTDDCNRCAGRRWCCRRCRRITCSTRRRRRPSCAPSLSWWSPAKSTPTERAAVASNCPSPSPPTAHGPVGQHSLSVLLPALPGTVIGRTPRTPRSARRRTTST